MLRLSHQHQLGLTSAILMALPIWLSAATTRPAVRNPHPSLKSCRLATGSIIRQLTNRAELRIDGWVNTRRGSTLNLVSIDPVTDGLTTTTVNLETQTEVVDRYRCYASQTDIGVGDHVQVWANARTNGIAQLVVNRNSWLVSLAGFVESSNAADHTFIFVVKRHNRDSIVTVHVTSETHIRKGNQPATFNDLTAGMKLDLVGRWNRTSQDITALDIHASVPSDVNVNSSLNTYPS